MDITESDTDSEHPIDFQTLVQDLESALIELAQLQTDLLRISQEIEKASEQQEKLMSSLKGHLSPSGDNVQGISIYKYLYDFFAAQAI